MSGTWATKRIPKAELWLLALITFVAALLRIPTLGKDSLWNDELWSWTISNYPTLGEVITKGSANDVHPPGYQSLLWAWIRLFGDSEVAMRSLSALAGLLAVPMLYLLGRRLFDGKTGLIASAMLACVVATPIYYSQEVRSYSLLLLMSIVSSHALAGLIETRRNAGTPTWLAVTGFGVSIVALAYVHYFGLLLAGLEIAFFACFIRKERTALFQVLAVGCLLFLAYLPWLPYFAKTLDIRSFWVPKPTLAYASKSYLGFLFGNSLVETAALLVLAFLPYWLFRKEIARLEWRRLLVLVAWVCIPWILAVAKSEVSTPIYQPRYMMVCVPAAYLLVAHGLSRWKWKPAVLATVLTALLLLDPVRFQLRKHYFTVPQKQEWREAAAYISDHWPNGGKAVLIAYGEQKGQANYYLERHGRVADLEATWPTEFYETVRTAIAEGSDYIWFWEGNMKPDAGLIRMQRKTGDQLDERQFLGIHITLYKISPQARRELGSRPAVAMRTRR